jgi:hypothetical protein
MYLERAILALRQQQPIDNILLKHLSPLGWEHINLTGDYVWHANKRVAAGRFRPSAIGPWLEKSNPSLQGSTPLQVMIFRNSKYRKIKHAT